MAPVISTFGWTRKMLSLQEILNKYLRAKGF